MVSAYIGCSRYLPNYDKKLLSNLMKDAIFLCNSQAILKIIVDLKRTIFPSLCILQICKVFSLNRLPVTRLLYIILAFFDHFSTEADKGNKLSLPGCRFHFVASMLSR